MVICDLCSVTKRPQECIGCPAGKKKKPKYRNKKVTVGGITFDSQKEEQHWQDLKFEEKAGAIKDLKRQVSFVLAPAVIIKGRKKPALRYFADFTYVRDGVLVVEDTKSDITRQTNAYRIKLHLMKSVHNIDIQEV